MSGGWSTSTAEQTLSEMTLAVKTYIDGEAVATAVHESMLPKLRADHDPGAKFCKEYKKQYRHLYARPA